MGSQGASPQPGGSGEGVTVASDEIGALLNSNCGTQIGPQPLHPQTDGGGAKLCSPCPLICWLDLPLAEPNEQPARSLVDVLPGEAPWGHGAWWRGDLEGQRVSSSHASMDTPRCARRALECRHAVRCTLHTCSHGHISACAQFRAMCTQAQTPQTYTCLRKRLKATRSTQPCLGLR